MIEVTELSRRYFRDDEVLAGVGLGRARAAVRRRKRQRALLVALVPLALAFGYGLIPALRWAHSATCGAAASSAARAP
jgi:hypothetical protein